jgi:hypothetical protein
VRRAFERKGDFRQSLLNCRRPLFIISTNEGRSR